MLADFTLLLDAGDGEEQVRVEICHQVMTVMCSSFKDIAEGQFDEFVTLRWERKLGLALPDTNVAVMKVLCDIERSRLTVTRSECCR